MSIFNKLFSFFRNDKNEELPPVPVPVTSPIPRHSLTPSEAVIYLYSHGFTNGVYRVDPDEDNFQEFLLASSESERIIEQRKENQQRLNEAKQQLRTSVTTSHAVHEILVDRTKSVEHIESQISEIDEDKRGRLDKHMTLKEQRNAIHSEYGWVPALLYLVAGAVFIVGDISITHQITSWGFDMKGIEGWVFAVGLAFTAFLIKPVVDRLLEKPFQKAGLQMKQVYKTVLLVITGLGLTMLFLLGKFRSESQVAATKLGDLNYQMQSLSDPNSAEYIKLADERKKINEDLTSNPVGEWGIILSGIIFAIGGALCMSIAFPSMSHLINRYWILPMKIHLLQKEMEKLGKERNRLKNESKIMSGEILKAQHRLTSFDFERMNEEIKTLEAEHARLLISYYEQQFNREKNLYQDGKNRGEKFNLDGELLYKAKDNDPTDLYHKNGKNGSDDSNKGPRRPFVKIRKMIADNYNKNQNNNSPDGTEFEILS